MKVLLTRPQGHNDAMAQALYQCGIEVIETPLMAIEAITPCQSELEVLQQARKAIFVSQHAVNYSTSYFNQLSKNCHVYSVGNRTEAALKVHHIPVRTVNSNRQDSEGVLSLAELQSVADECIVIIRGRGGREKLAQELRARGALVSYCEVYQRIMPKLDSQFIVQYWQQQGVDTILITSGEMLLNLLKLISNEQLHWLKKCRLIVPSERVASIAIANGLTQVFNAEGASQSAMLSTLEKIIAAN